MEWDFEGRTERRKGDFHKSWVCPFCHPVCYMNNAEKMFAVCKRVKSKQEEEDGVFTYRKKFATYHESNERAKELGPAWFPQLETPALEYPEIER